MTHTEERDAIEARLEAALVAAQTVDVAFFLKKALRNRQKWEPSAGDKALRGYRKVVGGRRLATGEGFDRHDAMIVVQIIVPLETGDDEVHSVYEAIKGEFHTAADGLEFEDTPTLVEAPRGETAATWDAMFPFYRYEFRSDTTPAPTAGDITMFEETNLGDTFALWDAARYDSSSQLVKVALTDLNPVTHVVVQVNGPTSVSVQSTGKVAATSHGIPTGPKWLASGSTWTATEPTSGKHQQYLSVPNGNELVVDIGPMTVI